ncbi:MAG: hypothetical protein AB2L11_03085 [Syntrophobacteraceae bacterium]
MMHNGLFSLEFNKADLQIDGFVDSNLIPAPGKAVIELLRCGAEPRILSAFLTVSTARHQSAFQSNFPAFITPIALQY